MSSSIDINLSRQGKMVDPLIGMTMTFNLGSSSSKAMKEIDGAPTGGTGSQVLPVADLDEDYDGTPEDGMEYLFMVRREAFAHPDVTRAAIYDLNQPEISLNTPAAKVVIPLDRPSEAWRAAFMIRFNELRKRMQHTPDYDSFPSALHLEPPSSTNGSAWKLYVYGRKQQRAVPVTTAVPLVDQVHSDAVEASEDWSIGLESVSEGLTEAEILAQAKALALASLELDAPSPRQSTPPIYFASSQHLVETEPEVEEEDFYDPPRHIPTVSLMLDLLDTRLILDILDHFKDWLEERSDSYSELTSFVSPTIFQPRTARKSTAPAPASKPARIRSPLPTAHELSWILSLLSILDSLLSGDEISSLRSLARTMLALSSTSMQELEARGENAVVGRSSIEKKEDEEDAEGRARCWMIVAAIAGVWRQKDLFDGDS